MECQDLGAIVFHLPYHHLFIMTYLVKLAVQTNNEDFIRGLWLAQSVEPEILGLGVMSSSPTVGLELTLKR